MGDRPSPMPHTTRGDAEPQSSHPPGPVVARAPNHSRSGRSPFHVKHEAGQELTVGRAPRQSRTPRGTSDIRWRPTDVIARRLAPRAGRGLFHVKRADPGRLSPSIGRPATPAPPPSHRYVAPDTHQPPPTRVEDRAARFTWNEAANRDQCGADRATATCRAPPASGLAT